MPIRPIVKNTYFHPKSCAIQPMSGAKMTVAKYCPELKKAQAVPRSALGNHAATTRALAGKDGASAKPTRKRRRKRAVIAPPTDRKPTQPCRKVKIDQTMMLTA